MTQLPQFEELLAESRDYWWSVRGAPEPPAPSFRTIDGQQVLGRYVDPWGAEGLMVSTKARWSQWYTAFLIGAGAGVLFGGVDFAFLFLALPVLVTWYLLKRSHLRKQYDSYYALHQEILRTDAPVWVPFDKHRLALIDRRPEAVWP
jgi:hypothetical protein